MNKILRAGMLFNSNKKSPRCLNRDKPLGMVGKIRHGLARGISDARQNIGTRQNLIVLKAESAKAEVIQHEEVSFRGVEVHYSVGAIPSPQDKVIDSGTTIEQVESLTTIQDVVARFPK